MTSDQPWRADGPYIFQGSSCIAIFDTDVGSPGIMTKRAARAANAVNTHDGLVEALENLIPRFRRALIEAGTDAEYAEEATRDYRRALELARQPKPTPVEYDPGIDTANFAELKP